MFGKDKYRIYWCLVEKILIKYFDYFVVYKIELLLKKNIKIKYLDICYL